MTSKILDKTIPWMADCLQIALSNNLLEQQEVAAVEQYARERLAPVTPWLILQYLAIKASLDYIDMASFQPLLRSSDNNKQVPLPELIQKLHNAHLLTAPESEKLRQWSIQHADCSTVELMSMAASIAQYSDFMAPERLLLFLEELAEAGIVDSSTLNQWRNHLQNGQPFHHNDLLRACRHGVVLEQKLQVPMSGDFLLELHQKTASVLPQLAFKDFSWEWLPEIADAICVYLSIDGQYYRMRSAATRHPDGNQPNWIDDHTYYHIFNKALVEQGAPYRLHHVSLQMLPFQPIHPNQSAWGILALTASQAPVLNRVEPQFFTPYIAISQESFQPVLDTSAWKLAFDCFHAIGLFDYLSEEAIIAFGEHAFQGYLTDYVNFLACFPDMLLFYDGETGMNTEPYRHLLSALEAISHGRFMPEDISDEFDPASADPFHLSFTLKGKYYSVNLLHSDTAYDPAFWRMVKRSNDEMNPGAGFYCLSTEDASKAIIYLTTPQFTAFQTLQDMRIEPI